MSPRRNPWARWVLVPAIAWALLGMMIVAGGARADAEEVETTPDPWGYLDARHDAPVASTGLVYDRAMGRWAWSYSPAEQAHVVLIAVYPEGERAEVFAETYGSGTGVDQCRDMVSWLKTRREIEARCIVLGLEKVGEWQGVDTP